MPEAEPAVTSPARWPLARFHLAVTGAHGLSVALACSAVGLATVAVCAPLFGLLSDRVGRRPLLVAGTGALLVTGPPLFSVAEGGSVPALLIADVAVGAALAMLVVSVHLSECFPREDRATGIALTYGLATAVLGGTAPVIGTVLAQRGHDAGTPLYLAVLSAAGLLASLRSPGPSRAAERSGLPSAAEAG